MPAIVKKLPASNLPDKEMEEFFEVLKSFFKKQNARDVAAGKYSHVIKPKKNGSNY